LLKWLADLNNRSLEMKKTFNRHCSKEQAVIYIPLGPRPPVLGNGNGSVVYGYTLSKRTGSTHRLFFELGSLNGGCAWLSNLRATTELVLNNLKRNSAKVIKVNHYFKMKTTAILE